MRKNRLSTFKIEARGLCLKKSLLFALEGLAEDIFPPQEDKISRSLGRTREGERLPPKEGEGGEILTQEREAEA